MNKGESIRVFPLSNWTELDIWQYIYLENIKLVPLYLAAERPVVERNGTLIMVDDERMRLNPGEVPQMKSVRFRTLGCYPLTGAVESTATTLPEIIQEMLLATTSERQGRMIDHDEAGSMERKSRKVTSKRNLTLRISLRSSAAHPLYKERGFQGGFRGIKRNRFQRICGAMSDVSPIRTY